MRCGKGTTKYKCGAGWRNAVFQMKDTEVAKVVELPIAGSQFLFKIIKELIDTTALENAMTEAYSGFATSLAKHRDDLVKFIDLDRTLSKTEMITEAYSILNTLRAESKVEAAKPAPVAETDHQFVVVEMWDTPNT